MTGRAEPRPDHIIVVIEENHGFNQIMGNPDAPFINSLVRQGTVFRNYQAITHPSEPNYLALFSGSTRDVRDDGAYFFNAPSLAGALKAAGFTILGYAEAGSPRKHNPWESFNDATDIGRSLSEFPTDFDKLPTVSFVVPNLDDDMHDGSVARADRWLRRHFSGYIDWAKTHNSIFILTFDEDEGKENNHVLTLAVGGSVSVGQNTARSNHLSLLRAIESLYNLRFLGDSGSAPLIDIVANKHRQNP